MLRYTCLSGRTAVHKFVIPTLNAKWPWQQHPLHVQQSTAVHTQLLCIMHHSSAYTTVTPISMTSCIPRPFYCNNIKGRPFCYINSHMTPPVWKATPGSHMSHNISSVEEILHDASTTKVQAKTLAKPTDRNPQQAPGPRYCSVHDGWELV